MQKSLIPDFLKGKVTILHQSAHAMVGWIAEDRILYQCIAGFLNGEPFKEHHIKLLEAAQTYRGTKIFNLTTDMNLITPENQQWGNEVLLPQLIATGLRRSAYVVPSSVFAQLSMNKISDAVRDYSELDLEMRPFDDEQQAYTWLKSIK